MLIFLNLDTIADFNQGLKDIGAIDDKGTINWEMLDGEFYEKLVPFRGSYQFYSALKKFGKVFFLTSCPVKTSTYFGKAEWVSYFGEFNPWRLEKFITCPSKLKHLLSGSGRTLIDSNLDSVQAWINAGGYAVHCEGSEQSYSDVLDWIKLIP